MRSCPYCGGEMEWIEEAVANPRQGSIDFLVCKERCQHRRCQVCEKDIHRGSRDDPNYYDSSGNATCWIEQYLQPDSLGEELIENLVGHQP